MTCTKRPFRSQAAAQSIVFKLRAQGVRGVDSYKCACGKWHVAKETRKTALRAD